MAKFSMSILISGLNAFDIDLYVKKHNIRVVEVDGTAFELLLQESAKKLEMMEDVYYVLEAESNHGEEAVNNTLRMLLRGLRSQKTIEKRRGQQKAVDRMLKPIIDAMLDDV